MFAWLATLKHKNVPATLVAVVGVASSGCSRQVPHHQREEAQQLVGKKGILVAAVVVGIPVDVAVWAVVLGLLVAVVCLDDRLVVQIPVRCELRHRRTRGEVQQERSASKT